MMNITGSTFLYFAGARPWISLLRRGAETLWMRFTGWIEESTIGIFRTERK